MTPTQEQIKQAQEAGNDAYNHAVTDACKPWMCYEAYRAAYDATLAQLQEQDPLAGVNWGAIRAELDAERAEMIRRETGQLDCDPAEFDDDENPWCGVTNSPVKRLAAFEHCAPVDWRHALECAAAETGVTAEHLTPEQVAMLEERTDEQSGIVDHDDWTQGAWK